MERISIDKESPVAGPEWTLLAAGDFCVTNSLEETHEGPFNAEKFITEELGELIAASDVAIINLEGPLGKWGKRIEKSGPHIRMDVSAPSVLRQMGFDGACLANNHIMDYGEEALQRTIEVCRREGLLVFGAGCNEDEAMEPTNRVIRGKIRLSIFSFCEREFGVAKDGNAGSAWISHPLAIECVAKAKQISDVVVVFAHGGVEYVPFSPIQRQLQLRQFVEAGATLVVGHHPHVPQGWEQYKGGMIFYSLGNFMFDYLGKIRRPKTEWGLVIQACFKGTNLRCIELVPVEMRIDRRVGKLGRHRCLQRHLEYLHRLSSMLSKPAAVIPYWQEIAVHLWETKYKSSFHANTSRTVPYYGSDLRSLIKNVFARYCSCNKLGTSLDTKGTLALLNNVRNESHRWTIETALGILSGDERDYRTPEGRKTMRELLAWTEGE